MIKNIISKISQEYIQEAKKSPSLFEDMAAMEKYMSESYSQRIFVELLQNADDAGSTKVMLFKHGSDIIFANNGKPFNDNDIVAISRSGASNKKRKESIGYRGIGFKSTVALSDEIIIYSDDTYFTFSKKLCSVKLQTSIEKTPAIRVPFIVDNVENDIKNTILSLLKDGFTTVFIFKNANLEDFNRELKLVNNGYFLFLNHICKCYIKFDDIDSLFELARRKNNNNCFVEFYSGNSSKWLVKSNQDVSIAFLSVQNRLVPCSESESVMHSYLPTEDTSPYFCKINGNFSTDPSRKHIVIDDITNKLLERASEFLFDILKDFINNPIEQIFSVKEILSILKPSNSYLRHNTIFRAFFDDLIKSNNWIKSNSNLEINPISYKLLPNYLENSEKNVIRKQSKLIQSVSLKNEIYENIDNIDDFFNKYSSVYVDNELFIKMMKDEKFVSVITEELHLKILKNIVKKCYTDNILGVKHSANLLSDVLIRVDDFYLKISEFSRSDFSKSTSFSFLNQLIKSLLPSECDWFRKEINLAELNKKSKGIYQPMTKVEKPTKLLRKWRTAEQNCLEIEKSLGNIAIDVSQKNLGYDIESLCRDGSKRYIEVKSVSKSHEFAITNNEYTAAHQYGKEYYVCLIFENEDKLSVTYISDPLKNSKFEKRVKQWEWLCLNYSGNKVIYNLD